MEAKKLSDHPLSAEGVVPAVVAKYLTRSYFGKPAIDNVSLEIAAGQIHMVAGINGAGKSTLIRALSGIEEADSGSAFIFGHNYRELSQSYRDKVFLITEDFAIDAPYSVRQFFHQLGGFYPHFNGDRFDEVASKFNLDTTRRFLEYSRGQKVQAQLAFAFAMGANLLFLDEVTAVLDLATRNTLRELLREFKEIGGTTIAATNIITDFNDIADKLIFVNKGKVLFNCELTNIDQQVRNVTVNSDEAIKQLDPNEIILQKRNADGSTLIVLPTCVVEKIDPKFIIDLQNVSTIEEIFLSERSARDIAP